MDCLAQRRRDTGAVAAAVDCLIRAARSVAQTAVEKCAAAFHALGISASLRLCVKIRKLKRLTSRRVFLLCSSCRIRLFLRETHGRRPCGSRPGDWIPRPGPPRRKKRQNRNSTIKELLAFGERQQDLEKTRKRNRKNRHSIQRMRQEDGGNTPSPHTSKTTTSGGGTMRAEPLPLEKTEETRISDRNLGQSKNNSAL